MTSDVAGSLGRLTVADGNGVASLRAELVRQFDAAIATAFPGMDGVRAEIAPTKPALADYQCNNAMGLFGRLKGRAGAPANPRAAAQAILDALPASPLVAETSLAGPGFINIRLSKQWLGAHIRSMLRAGIQSWAPGGYTNRRVIVDFRCGT